MEGLGLEDLKGCERFFSKSNALAPGTQHASTFHQCQAISEYALFTDKFETYTNLSKSFYTQVFVYLLPCVSGMFLLSNYKQALSLLEMKPMVVAALAKAGASSGDAIKGWLQEEEAYLCGLSKEPL